MKKNTVKLMSLALLAFNMCMFGEQMHNDEQANFQETFADRIVQQIKNELDKIEIEKINKDPLVSVVSILQNTMRNASVEDKEACGKCFGILNILATGLIEASLTKNDKKMEQALHAMAHEECAVNVIGAIQKNGLVFNKKIITLVNSIESELSIYIPFLEGYGQVAGDVDKKRRQLLEKYNQVVADARNEKNSYKK